MTRVVKMRISSMVEATPMRMSKKKKFNQADECTFQFWP